MSVIHCSDSNTNKVLQGNIEALEQGLSLMRLINDEQYLYVAEPYVKSSIGKHMRHILDVYFSVYQSLEGGKVFQTIDYDLRRRGALVETDRSQAIRELEQLLLFIPSLNGVDLSQSVNISTEVLLSASESVATNSNLERELIFTSSHAVHHYALIGIIAKLQDVNIDDAFGVAPATATFFRKQVVTAS